MDDRVHGFEAEPAREGGPLRVFLSPLAMASRTGLRPDSLFDETTASEVEWVLWHHGDELTAMLGEILDLFADGTFKPMVDRSFPFNEAAAAHRYIQERKNYGKVVLTP